MNTELHYSQLAADPDLSDLVTQFVEELPDRLERMVVCEQEEAWGELARNAHQLKGAVGSYGFHTLTPFLVDLERSARLAEDFDEIHAALHDVRIACNHVQSTPNVDNA